MKDPDDAKEVSDEEAHFAADELSKRYNERYKRKMEMVKKLVSDEINKFTITNLEPHSHVYLRENK